MINHMVRKNNFLSYLSNRTRKKAFLAPGNNQPQTPSVRALAGWWWLFCVIIIASYSSKLISSITVRITAPAVTSMLDMVESRRILWTYQANSAMEELFKVGVLDYSYLGLILKGYSYPLSFRMNMLIYSTWFYWLQDS